MVFSRLTPGLLLPRQESAVSGGVVLRPAPVILLGAAWMATVCNLPLWRALHETGLLRGAAGVGLAMALSLALFGVLSALLSLLAWRWTLKPALTLLLVLAAGGAYFMETYHIVIDPTMWTNVLQTDAREASALIGLRWAAWMIVLAGLPLAFLWRGRITYAAPHWQAVRNACGIACGLALAAAAVLAAFQPLASAMRNHKELRYLINPLNTLYAAGSQAAVGARRKANSPPLPVGQDAYLAAAGTRPALLLLVLGETARADHFSLNGYARPTNPELAREDVVSWRNAWSCGTNTAASVPCMFSHLGRDRFGAANVASENLLDVLQHAGLAVLWVDNQAGCKGVCDRVPHGTTEAKAAPDLCRDGECQDEALLRGLDARIQALPPERRAHGVVVVLHQMGSHGPAYSQRSPSAYKRFLPECTSINLQDCSADELRNAYDNSLLYTDHVLASAIHWLKAREASHDTALLYVADHGESLGENNLYLHGLPYSIAPDVQKHVPWVTWLSASFQHDQGINAPCLRERAVAPVSHDNLFHSVLGLMSVRTGVYAPALDAYAGCRTAPGGIDGPLARMAAH
ncbi:phosphoethanolamine--lipid A transferase [Ramlibacter solisilvae]|uniref:phosphoethanolamine transferase n=1 Tax=Ramlibacter tataouinensis TaxID=94132 RepID=UPI000777E7E8|nr:phosphoethanolamine--lipid A transferase [Ramlibacter tataouinensis]